MLDEYIRRTAFWAIDTVKKGSTQQHCGEIQSIIENKEDQLDIVEKKLRQFLDFAIDTTEYYSEYKGCKELGDFPVIDKSTLKTNYGKFLSFKYRQEDLVRVKTSGSYGTPFTFLLTKEKKARQRAEIIYFGHWADYNIGMKHAYIRANDNKSKLKLFIQNEVFMKTDSFEEEWLEDKRKVIIEKNIKGLIGFPSAISAIARYCLDRGDTPETFKIKSIITSGESLYDNQRTIIEKAFGTTCLSRYSTEELGVLAHECREYHNHHINNASYYIEVLKLDKDEPVEVGELGRIVVTDLYSHAMPLIRYETGDLAVKGGLCKCGLKTPTLLSVEGRNLEMILTTTGKKLPPFFVNPIMKDFEQIIQFQFAQVAKKRYILRLVSQSKMNIQEDVLRGKFIKQIGSDADFSIEYVDSIPTIRSGKRAYVVNEYLKK